MAARLFSAALLASGLPAAVAWGAMGHEAVAYVATNFVASSTKTYFQTLLADTSANYLASVAAWADSYRSTTAGKFSAPFHYIDANDNPPSSCSVEYSRDCGSGGCVVSAIANYTSRMLTSSLSTSEKQIAAKMLIHFIGDIGQPLHCENLDVGGNDIDVTFNGGSTNLHAVWDSSIPEAISGGSSLTSAKSWATTLTTSINSGSYKSLAAGWVSGLSITSAQATALVWAQESNADVCSTVLAKGVTWVEDNDLSGSYTTTATPVVNLQIAKQGYRLAKWLDAIAAAV
ncbi:S1/P1 nuclease [Thozetella sp. PMI_491]|nr:S1/P1 nuclease [Thozetella sp. PMI_491]